MFQSPLGEGVVQTSQLQKQIDELRKQFQSPLGEGVVQTSQLQKQIDELRKQFQSPLGEGVVQTANPRARMVMRQTGIWIFEKHLLCFILPLL